MVEAEVGKCALTPTTPKDTADQNLGGHNQGKKQNRNWLANIDCLSIGKENWRKRFHTLMR